MKGCKTPFIPPSKVGTVVPSSPLQNPLHPPSQTHPHTPKGCAPALRGNARPVFAFRSIIRPSDNAIGSLASWGSPRLLVNVEVF